MTEVRPATVADIPTLVALMEEFYAESGFPLDRGWAGAAFAALLAEPTRGGAWLLLSEGLAIGHVVLSTRFAMEFGGFSAIIDDLFVRPAHRRQGAARRGLEALVAEAAHRGCRSLHVEVDPANHAAVALYRSFGLAPGSDNRLHLGCTLPD